MLKLTENLGNDANSMELSRDLGNYLNLKVKQLHNALSFREKIIRLKDKRKNIKYWKIRKTKRSSNTYKSNEYSSKI